MKVGVILCWWLVKGVGVGVGRGIVDEVDIGFGNEVGEVFEL